MTTARYQLLKDTYMPLNGQWQIVLSGTVFDDDTAIRYSPSSVTVLSPGESASTLAAHGKATSVRGVRTK